MKIEVVKKVKCEISIEEMNILRQANKIIENIEDAIYTENLQESGLPMTAEFYWIISDLSNHLDFVYNYVELDD